MPIILPTIQTLTSLPIISVTLKDWLETDDMPAGRSINYNLVAVDQFGVRMRDANDQGNLASHMDDLPYTLVQMQGFIMAVRELAESILLPLP